MAIGEHRPPRRGYPIMKEFAPVIDSSAPIRQVPRLLVNFLGYDAVWLAAVGGAAAGWWFAGPIAASAFLVLHALIFRPALWEWQFIGAAALLGTGIDSMLLAMGLVDYRYGSPFGLPIAPLWITALWAGFAATLHHSLKVLASRPWLAMVLGAIAGPLSYFVADAIGAVTLPRAPSTTIVALAIVWAVTMPIVYAFGIWLRRRNGGSV